MKKALVAITMIMTVTAMAAILIVSTGCSMLEKTPEIKYGLKTYYANGHVKADGTVVQGSAKNADTNMKQASITVGDSELNGWEPSDIVSTGGSSHGDSEQYLVFGMMWTNNTGKDASISAIDDKYELSVYQGDKVIISNDLSWNSEMVKNGATTFASAGGNYSTNIDSDMTADDTIEIVVRRNDREVLHDTVKISDIPVYEDAAEMFQ